MSRPTIRTIADALGLSNATVSLALREHPRIPVSTRQKVQATARELGYYRDPSISKLMTRIRSNREVTDMTKVALLNANPVKHLPGLSQYHQQVFQGMQDQGHELGYHIEPFWLKEKGMTARRMSHILESRGIQGIIVSPIKDFGTILEMKWEAFSAVTIGYSLLEPRLNRIVGNQRQAIFTSLQKLLETGHQRIGAIWHRNFDLRMTFISSSVFHWFHAQLPDRRCIPFLSIADFDREIIRSWIDRYQPDAIVTHIPYLAEILRDMGYRIPEDFSVVAEGSEPDDDDLTGCFVSPYHIGRRAMKMLDGQLLQNEFGIPELPLTTLMEMQWEAGKTLSARGPRDPLAAIFEQTAW